MAQGPCLLQTGVCRAGGSRVRARRHRLALDRPYPDPGRPEAALRGAPEAVRDRSFPTGILATPDGRPYTRTPFREALQTLESYWKHLASLRERGRRLR